MKEGVRIRNHHLYLDRLTTTPVADAIESGNLGPYMYPCNKDLDFVHVLSARPPWGHLCAFLAGI